MRIHRTGMGHRGGSLLIGSSLPCGSSLAGVTRERKDAEMSLRKGDPKGSDALILFGVTGDLARKMIFPALYAMTKRGALNVPVIGVAAPKWSLAQLRRQI